MNDVFIWREQISRDCACLSRTPREALAFTTIVIDVRIIHDPGVIPADIVAISRAFPSEIYRCMRLSGRVKRGTRWAGAIEYDLLTPKLLGGARKRKLAEALGVDFSTLTTGSRVLVTHAHLVMDASGHRSTTVMTDAIRAKWPGAYRVLSKPLHTDKTVAENLEILAGYMTKLKTRYSQAWLGDRTQYGPDYEPVWKVFNDRLVTQVGYDKLRVCSVRSRAAAGGIECPPLSAEVAENSTKSMSDLTSQLTEGATPLSQSMPTARVIITEASVVGLPQTCECSTVSQSPALSGPITNGQRTQALRLEQNDIETTRKGSLETERIGADILAHARLAGSAATSVTILLSTVRLSAALKALAAHRSKASSTMELHALHEQLAHCRKQISACVEAITRDSHAGRNLDVIGGEISGEINSR